MSGWTAEDLATIEAGDEIRIGSRRPDGTLRPFVRVWFARLGDDLYVRSAYGPENGWYRRAKASGVGRIKAKGLERDVAIEVPARDVDELLHAAYRARYDRYPPKIVATVVTPEAAACTLRLDPRG